MASMVIITHNLTSHASGSTQEMEKKEFLLWFLLLVQHLSTVHPD
jgi:hypothetical protein